MPTDSIQYLNQAEPLMFLMVSNADHISPATGAAPVVTISKNGGAFAPPVGVVSEVGNGWYKVAASPSDANILGTLVLHATGTGADVSDTTYDVVDYAPTNFVPGSSTIVSLATGQGESFEDVWRKVRLYAPNAPAMLCRHWVQNAWGRLSDRRQWGWLVSEGQLVWQDAITLDSVTTSIGSRTVTSAGLFTIAMIGRQFRAGNYPIYTVVARPDVNTITLDRPYETYGSVGAVEAQIVDAYATLPRGFGTFLVLVDPIYQRLVPWWASWDEIALLDPVRSAASTTPQILGSRKFSVSPLAQGQVQYQYWPIPTAAGALQYYGVNRPIMLPDDHVFTGVLAERTDVLIAGALAQCAKYPGTAQQKNPYFNLQLAKMHDDEFRALANQLDLRDDDEYPQSWDVVPWQKFKSWAWAYPTHLLQATDATLGAYWGAGGSGWTL